MTSCTTLGHNEQGQETAKWNGNGHTRTKQEPNSTKKDHRDARSAVSPPMETLCRAIGSYKRFGPWRKSSSLRGINQV